MRFIAACPVSAVEAVENVRFYVVGDAAAMISYLQNHRTGIVRKNFGSFGTDADFPMRGTVG